MEKDREDAKEKAMQGKEVTSEFCYFCWNHFAILHIAGHHGGKDCQGWGDCGSIYQESVEVKFMIFTIFCPYR